MKEIKINDKELVLSCAFRYALGRMTYVTEAISNELIQNKESLSKEFKTRIAKEIQEYQNNFGKAGHDCDNNAWNKVKLLFNENIK